MSTPRERCVILAEAPAPAAGDVRHHQSKTRLAPSPTGALHLGNARTFLVNWALARQRGWRILLRIEDLDTPRVKSGAVDGLTTTLHALGLDWDEGPMVQSLDLAPYAKAMQTLASRSLVYPSAESRGEIERAAESSASAPQEGASEIPFPASMRPAALPRVFEPGGAPCNWRFATPDEDVCFADVFAGPQRRRPSATIGDFVVWTKRGLPSYQLAVTVDDRRQGITHVVRGDDLLDSAARQILLRRSMSGGPDPEYFHLPLVRGPDGKRLAKRHGDTRVDSYLARGVPPERVIGLIAWWCGVEGPRRSMPAGEFRERFFLDRLPRRDIVFSEQDDQWLLKGWPRRWWRAPGAKTTTGRRKR
jgi:glutamyl-tRNA synthetase